jgi:DedD protein
LASLAEDLNVDELRRRARRRLVGAIVLALAAAVIVPMLLESEPRPLGEDVAVKIPPVDDGKFVNRLNDPTGKSAPAAPKGVPQTAPPRSEPAAAPKPEAPKPEAPKPEAPKPDAAKDAAAPASAPITTAPTADTTAKVDTAPKADAGAAPAASAPAASAPAPSAPSPSASKAPATPDKGPVPEKAAPPADKAATANGAARVEGAFAVQLAAFSDDKGANALAGKLKRAGYSAYTEPLKTSKGTLWRVRVGPYPSRDAANAARDKLKSEGQNGIVAAAH